MNKKVSLLGACIATLITPVVGGSRAHAGEAQIDLPTQISWPALQRWDKKKEAQYSEFIVAIGRAVAAGACRTLSACLNDPTINPLHEGTTQNLRFHADCADVPYILRAYFSYRHDLPFAYAKTMQGRGRDARYYRDARPAGLRLWLEFPTPRRLFERLSNIVHSGFFRTAPSIENADFYQTTIDRSAIHPGTMFYDPNGHVLIVYEVRKDGEILTFDGHPDGYLTHGPLTEKNVRGGTEQGGGFKNFRPLSYEEGRITQAENAAIPDFGGTAPFDTQRYQVQGCAVGFHAWVRACLAQDAEATTVARF